jgi:acrylyl-CoA reductase (NADPH)
MEPFSIYRIDRDEKKVQTAAFVPGQRDELPEGDVLIRVRFSSINYKDALAVTGRGPVIRRFPMVPGIDLAGEVIESETGEFRPGERVLVTGHGIGETHWGGYAGYARLPASWVLRVPDALSLRRTMAVGTAGLTAMLSIEALAESGVVAEDGDVLVTGASGGVGTFSVALLAALGYRVVASSGRPDAAGFLGQLGAEAVIGRGWGTDEAGRALGRERWSGAIDTVGGESLAAIIRTLNYGSAVAACGNAGGADLATSVYPFILRGVRLLGIDSVQCSRQRREKCWARISEILPDDQIDRLHVLEDWRQLPELAEAVLDGRMNRRIVLSID